MPPDTKKVDRTTKWGNPFVIGTHGTQQECVDLFDHALQGLLAEGSPHRAAQLALRETLAAHGHELRGKHLACWCRVGEPCHADLLLRWVNA